jgi:soluble lytic murein transglycosylase-like protein
MPRKSRRKWRVIAAAIPIAIGLALAGVYLVRRAEERPRGEALARPKPEAPPDLEKLRNSYTAGLDALQRGDGGEAIRYLSSFNFGPREVEEYRLYYLATAHQLVHDRSGARGILALLQQRQPQFVYADDAGLNLAGLYSQVADWLHASLSYSEVGAWTDSPAVAASARWGETETRFFDGDLPGALAAARAIAIRSPRSPQAAWALAVIRGISGIPDSAAIPLTASERLERGVCLLRDGDPQSAFDELTALEPVAPSSIRAAVELNRGLALNQLHRYDDSNKVLEPLASGPYRVAIPAIYTAARNYRSLSASIVPFVNRIVVQRQRVGTVRVRVGKGTAKHFVVRPKFANVRKTVQLVDLAKAAKKDDYDRLALERSKDLLQIRSVAAPVRLEVLNTLIAIAEAKNQDPYEQELISEAVKLDPFADPGLQHFWDKAWAAYVRADLSTAQTLLRFIADTYGNPNVKRQAVYWYARTIERADDRQQALEIYRELAAAPYQDVYALYAVSRGAPLQSQTANPLKMNRPDWRDIAEQTMPAELRRAYELTALYDMRDAQLEIRKNAKFSNQRFADALMSDLYNSSGNIDLLYRTLRRAFPQLATVEQDSVPPYFIRMYYPVRYEEAIKKDAKRFAVDPYLVMALILQESSFQPNAKSRVGATGLMQLMPATGKELGQKLHGRLSIIRIENPETNIELGTYHVQHMIQLFGNNVQLAVASYNAGQGNVLRWRRAAPSRPMDEFLESIPFPETRNYVKRVTLLRSSYARIAQ